LLESLIIFKEEKVTRKSPKTQSKILQKKYPSKKEVKAKKELPLPTLNYLSELLLNSVYAIKGLQQNLEKMAYILDFYYKEKEAQQDKEMPHAWWNQ